MYGDLVVQFNHTVNPKVNVTTLNLTTVDIFVEPAVNEDYSLEDRLLQNLNMTWKL